MTTCNGAIGLFLCLAVFVQSSTATWYNESALEDIYVDGAKLYHYVKHHWSMSSGYNEMLGDPGMKVCFVEGPEVEALILGAETNTTNITLQLQDSENPVTLPEGSFTVAFWYSFRPVEFLNEVNNKMACNLLQIGDALSISYEGLAEYNLNYKYGGLEINDINERPHMDFLVNDTDGGVVNRTWQWNHVAMVFNDSDSSIQAYFNGHHIAVESSGTFARPANVEELWLNAALGNKNCTEVGFDEVTLWDTALLAENLLAVRLFVGRDRNRTYFEPTTAEPTTPLATTTEVTTMEQTTAEDTTPAMTTAESTVDPETTSGSMTTDKMTTSAGGTTSPSVTSTAATTMSMSSSTDVTTDAATTTTGISGEATLHTTSKPTTVSPAPTSKGATTPVITTTTQVMTTISKKQQQLKDIEKNVTATTDSVEIVDIIVSINQIVLDATVEETSGIADNIVKLTEVLAQVKIQPLNNSNETKAATDNYRKAFVNLVSSVLVKTEETQTTTLNGERLLDAVNSFLENYVEDEEVISNEYLQSEAMDIKVSVLDGKPLELDGNTTVDIPKDIFGAGNSKVRVLVCVLRTGLQNLLEPQDGEQPVDVTEDFTGTKTTWNISGPILAIRVSGHQEPVQLQSAVVFKIQIDTTLGVKPLCAYQAKSMWSGKGLDLVKYDAEAGYVSCQTDHMTNFAVLMAVNGAREDLALSIISYIGCSCSLFCLFISIILFIILRELNSTRMGIIKNLCVALFLAQLLFVAGVQTASAHPTACKLVAALLHYFFLSVMAWMLSNGIYLYLKVKRAARPGSVVDLIYFCVLGWGVPAIVVAITAGINHKVYATENLCWLSVTESGIWAFVIPAMAIILFNAFVMFLTMKAFVSVKVFKDKNDKDKFKAGLRAMVVLLPILGLSWVFGLLAFDSGPLGTMFQYLFAVFNSLQGVFLFVFHILLNEEVKGAMRRRFGKVGASGEENMLFNKIWAFSSSGGEKTEMSSVTQDNKQSRQAPVYKN